MIPGPQSFARVVVVDDDRLLRELVRDAIQARAVVECCESAEAALAALARQPAELVVSDLSMPGLSGIQLLGRIRREHPGTDFVLLTGHASTESAVEALRMGAADYLVKPVRPEELALVVDRVLARRRLLAENERLRDELRAVDSCRSLMGCLEPGEVYVVALDLLLTTLSCERGVVLFRRPSVPTSDGVAFRGFGESEASRLRSVLVSDKPFELEAYESIVLVSEGRLHDALRELGIPCRSTLVVPIRGRETEVGVIWLFVDGDDLDEGLLERTKLVAGHAELALHNAERYYHAKERAFIDDVTEVYNARFLLQATAHEIQRAERYGRDLSLLFLDLDRFKLVNDRYGHLTGSEVLRRLSRVLQDCIRQVDTLARYGGDEFTVLLGDTGNEEGMVIAERIRRTVQETLFQGGRGTPIRLTISIGVATFPEHAGDRDSLLDAADKAMYRAKSLGRNCCCSASDL
jgi:two-component system cell cycle response regulator